MLIRPDKLRRGHKSEHSLLGLAAVALVLGGLFLGMMPAPASAQSCEVSFVSPVIGHANQNFSETHTFEELSLITAVSVNQLQGNAQCPSGSYFFSENRLTATGRCRASFNVTGIEADCATGAAGGVAQVPLFLTASADPNIMFLLDDSGSMQFEILPDEYVFWGVQGRVGEPGEWGDWKAVSGLTSEACGDLGCIYHREGTGYVLWTYPRTMGVYGAGDYGRWYTNVATVEGLNLTDITWPAYAALTRSAQVNSTYYNPAITYVPWNEGDGNQFPDADPGCAVHNPRDTALGCRALNVVESARDRWAECTETSYSTNFCERTFDPMEFWPATYFYHQGGDVWNSANYERTFIRPEVATYTGQGREQRIDCAGADDPTEPFCTYGEEIQNFANWYSYYRSRILASRAGIGRAFVQLPETPRIGFGAINKATETIDGVSSGGTIVKGVRAFTGSDREAFFDLLYDHPIPAAGTPLRRALDDAGQYFSRSDNAGPWGEEPGVNNPTPHLECRRSFSVLMTDGYWNSDAATTTAARANNDGTDGVPVSGPGGASYTYTAGPPFADAFSNTLADVAMYYWKNDLRSGLENRVPVTPANPAFWQHMTTFGVGLGVAGNEDSEDAFAAIHSGEEIDWAQPFPDAGAANIDDLLHAAVNSRGGFFSATEPDVFARKLGDTLRSIVGEAKSSAASVATNSTRLDTDTLIYQARFDSSDWSGELAAYRFLPGGVVGNLQWTTDTVGKIPDASMRNVLTWNGSNGLDFKVADWDFFTAGQRSALQAGGSVVSGQARLNWIRGDQSLEGDQFRERQVLLGDIVYSNPFLVSNQSFGFEFLPGDEGWKYDEFRSTEPYVSRPTTIYVGANDGMLHGFDAETGVERVAYVPKGVFEHLADLPDPNYLHRFYVDGSPRVVDAYIDIGGGVPEWRTVLVGSTGAGGKSVFALDVTDPTDIGPEQVLWEIEAGHLGYAIGQPTIARLESGNWVALFGNGYQNSSNRAKLIVVDLASGNVLKAIDTQAEGTVAQPNGLSEVVPVFLGNTRITEYVYAGDLYGNMWKFDLKGNTGQWDVAYKQGNTPRPLFQATDANGVPQPITARPVVVAHPDQGQMVMFGTGKFFEEGDELVNENTQIQAFYGIHDTGQRVSGARESTLQSQSILFQGTFTFEDDDGTEFERDVRVTSNNEVSNTQRGWYLDLIYDGVVEGERVVTRAIFHMGRVVFSTMTPDPDPCGFGGSSWFMELEAFSGSRPEVPVIDLNEDGSLDNFDLVTFGDLTVPASGTRPVTGGGMFGTPTLIMGGDIDYKVLSTTDGAIEVIQEQGSGDPRRESWRQLR